jgi:hypothetical protein
MTDLTGTWLRPPAAARYLGISASTLAKWRLRGFGPKWTKLSKAVAYNLGTLEEFAQSNLRSSTSDIMPGTAAGTPPPRSRGPRQTTSPAPEGGSHAPSHRGGATAIPDTRKPPGGNQGGFQILSEHKQYGL